MSQQQTAITIVAGRDDFSDICAAFSKRFAVPHQQVMTFMAERAGFANTRAALATLGPRTGNAKLTLTNTLAIIAVSISGTNELRFIALDPGAPLPPEYRSLRPSDGSIDDFTNELGEVCDDVDIHVFDSLAEAEAHASGVGVTDEERVSGTVISDRHGRGYSIVIWHDGGNHEIRLIDHRKAIPSSHLA